MSWDLKLIHRLASPGCKNYTLKAWPPSDGTPITINRDGTIASVFEDVIFDLSAYTRTAQRIRFDDIRLSNRNASQLKIVVCWWLWRSRSRLTAQSIIAYFNALKPLFLFASSLDLTVQQVNDSHSTASQLAAKIAPSSFSTVLMLLHDLYDARDDLGFLLLSPSTLTRLRALAPDHAVQQTPYIPARIWLAQLNRLKECIDGYIKHKQGFEDLFRFCASAYRDHNGSIEIACNAKLRKKVGPFNADSPNYLGSFASIARRYGVDDHLRLALRDPNRRAIDEDLAGIQRLGTYFNLVRDSSICYILNFTAMRSIEAKILRSSSYRIDQHDQFGDIHLIVGDAAKARDQEGVAWITSPSTAAAIDAMRSVSALRIGIAREDPTVSLTAQDIEDPLLYLPSYEPWMTTGEVTKNLGPQGIRRPVYTDILSRFPNLVPEEELRITEADLHMARQITPSLEPSIYKEGAVWPLAFHQLRRTAVVNMTASGLVDSTDVQFQLKHLTREQSLYYGSGYSNLRLSERARREFISATYESFARQAKHLSDGRYISPVSSVAKENIIRIIGERDSAAMLTAAKKGLISVRRTLFGLCTRYAPCPFGGFDNVSKCGSCSDALIDSHRKSALEALNGALEVKATKAPPDSARMRYLRTQQSSILSALSVIRKTKAEQE